MVEPREPPTGSLFSHKKRLNSLTLTDIYVYPDLKPIIIDALSSNKAPQRVHSKDVPNHISSGTRFLISGSDNIGKSALLKSLYMDLSREVVPLLINGEVFKGKMSEGRFQNIINEAVREQYDVSSVERFSRLDPARRLLLVDDFHKADLSQSAEAKFTTFAENQFGHVVIAISDIYRVRELSRRREEIDPFKRFAKLEIAEFGHGLRAKLIYKWLALGRETASELQALNYEAPATEKIITTLLGKNIVPAIPFNVLTLLHTIESTQSHVTANPSYGALYEFLISNSFSLSGAAKGADVYFNYASLVAYKMFEQERNALTEAELRTIKKEFYEIFHIDPDLKTILNDLKAVKILELTPAGSYSFKYKHLYYYFVAKYFQRVLKRSDERAAVLRKTLIYLADRLHSEEAANIILFYLHFSQDYGLIQHLLKGAREIYQALEACDFESHAEFVNKLYVEPPKKLLLLDDNVEAHREEYHQKADASEESDGVSITLDSKATYDETLSDVHKINIAFKTLQVLGQILRSSAQLMEGDLKLEIATESYFLGLRALRALLGLVENNVDDLRLYFSVLIKERAAFLEIEQEMTDEKLMKWTDEGVIWLTQSAAFGVVKKISYAVGHQSLSETYERILDTHGKNIGIAMSDVCIRLDHLSTVPEFEINVVRDRVLRNRFSSSVLRSIVMDHLYLRRIDVRMQQKLGAMFDIESVTKPKLLLE